MAGAQIGSAPQVRNFTAPDEVRTIVDKCVGRLVKIGGSTVWEIVFEPGWRWSIHNKPTATTASCPVHHFGYALSGRMRFRMDDGPEFEVGASDIFDVPAGHDAWVVGDEPCRFFHWAFGEGRRREVRSSPPCRPRGSTLPVRTSKTDERPGAASRR